MNLVSNVPEILMCKKKIGPHYSDNKYAVIRTIFFILNIYL